MPTIIDSLLVTLGLDTSEFDAKKVKVDKSIKDTGNEADKTGGKFKKTGKDGAEGFNKVAASATKFLALIGGTMAVKRFIEQTVDSNAALDRLSKNLQESVSTVSAWSTSAELAGGSAEGLQGTLDMLSKSQTELQLTGQSQLIPYFSALGVSLADMSGKARSGNDILLDLADRFEKMDRTTANNLGRMMGIDQGTMNLLLKGRKEVELMVARQKEYAAVTKRQAEESSRLKLAMTESKQSFEAFGRELLSAAMPALEGLLSLLKNFGTWARENKEFIDTFLTIIAVGLAGIAAATIPINLTIAAVTALSAAIALLWQDYQTWKRGGDSFIDWSKWAPGFTAAGKGIKWLKDLLGDMVYRAIAAADVLSAVFDRDWKRAKFAIGEFKAGTGKKYGEDVPPAPAQASKPAPAPAQASKPVPAPAQASKPVPAPAAPAAPVAPAQASKPVPAPAAPAQASKPVPAPAAPAQASKPERAPAAPAVGTVNSKAKPGGVEQEQRAMEFFQKQGWSREQAAGLAANLKRESAFDPMAVGDKGSAYGIAQWHPDRQAEFKKRFGKDIRQSTFDEQLAFVHYELTEGNERRAGGKLRKAVTAEDAAATVSTHYERPADKDGEAAKRAQLATAMLKPKTYLERREAAGVASPQPAPTAMVPAVRPAPVAGLGGVPGASRAAQGAGASQVAQANAPATVQEVSKSVETHIGEVKVYTAATDAEGVANDMARSLDYSFTAQGNYGLF